MDKSQPRMNDTENDYEYDKQRKESFLFGEFSKPSVEHCRSTQNQRICQDYGKEIRNLVSQQYKEQPNSLQNVSSC